MRQISPFSKFSFQAFLKASVSFAIVLLGPHMASAQWDQEVQEAKPADAFKGLTFSMGPALGPLLGGGGWDKFHISSYSTTGGTKVENIENKEARLLANTTAPQGITFGWQFMAHQQINEKWGVLFELPIYTGSNAKTSGFDLMLGTSYKFYETEKITLRLAPKLGIGYRQTKVATLDSITATIRRNTTGVDTTVSYGATVFTRTGIFNHADGLIAAGWGVSGQLVVMGEYKLAERWVATGQFGFVGGALLNPTLLGEPNNNYRTENFRQFDGSVEISPSAREVVKTDLTRTSAGLSPSFLMYGVYANIGIGFKF